MCPACLDSGLVCEDHPSYPAFADVPGHAEHAAGMPCPACCSPIPCDGTRSIVEAFTPDDRRRQ